MTCKSAQKRPVYLQRGITKAAKAVGALKGLKQDQIFTLGSVWGMVGDQQNFGEIMAEARRRRRRG